MSSCDASIVLTPRPEGILAINRANLKAVTFPSSAYGDLIQLMRMNTNHKPEWFLDALKQLESPSVPEGKWGDYIHLRDQSQMDVRRLAWEVTERCNFRCVHCYLDEKKNSGVPMEKRLLLLDRFQEMGCIWLQMTGGEVLADPLFEQTYKAAWQRGFVITLMTNGMFLSKWIGLLKKYPPKKIIVSLYGASGESYSNMAKTAPSAFQTVFENIQEAHKAGIRLRVSIVGSVHNAHEILLMEEIFEKKGIEYHTFSNFIPTVRGNPEPTKHITKLGRPITFFQMPKKCTAGRLSLHVFSTGRASPCKVLPNISIDLLKDDIQEISRMEHHPGCKSVRRECDKCPSAKYCTTCGPMYGLHKTAGHIPSHVCQWH